MTAHALPALDKMLATASDWFGQGRVEEARGLVAERLAAGPAPSRVHILHSVILLAGGDAAGALAAADEAARLSGLSWEAHGQRALALSALDLPEAALAACDLALRFNPKSARLLTLRGTLLQDLVRHGEAVDAFDRALALAPDDGEAGFKRSVSLLTLGRLGEGFATYERRFDVSSAYSRPQSFTQPRWEGGMPIAGRSILLHCEQGLGDTIQFCRYALRLAAAGAAVTLVTREPLRRLMQTLQGVEAVILFGDPLPSADYHLGFMSLPAALGTTLETIPAEVPYLTAPDDARAAWRDVSRPGERRRVGIAWRGNAGHRNDRHRSLPLEVFLDGLPEGPDYVCLLHDVTSEEADLLACRGDVEVHSGRIRDLADTAAICETLDLVISVDTSIAHLAGALALPVLVMLPHNPDWRWMLDRQDSPWYPTARLFRRPVGQGWAPTLAAVKDAVVAAVSGGRAR